MLEYLAYGVKSMAHVFRFQRERLALFHFGAMSACDIFESQSRDPESCKT